MYAIPLWSLDHLFLALQQRWCGRLKGANIYIQIYIYIYMCVFVFKKIYIYIIYSKGDSCCSAVLSRVPDVELRSHTARSTTGVLFANS